MVNLKFNATRVFKFYYSTLINGSINKSSEYFIKGNDKSTYLLNKINQIKLTFSKGGGETARLRHVNQNRKTLVTDRLNILFDKSKYLEIGQLAGYGMSYGDIPKAGGLAAFGNINNRLCLVSASDATVKGGAVYPIQLRKQFRLQDLSMNLRLPIIFIVDAAGAFLPLQAEIFPDKDHGGRHFYNQAVLQSKGIPAISLVCGSCTAGGAYIPTMCSENGMILKSGHIFLGGPPLVKAAIGETISADDLGGAVIHTRVSGCSDHIFQTERDGLLGIRDIISTIPKQSIMSQNIENVVDPLYPSTDLNGLLLNNGPTDSPSRTLMMQILARIVDGSCLHEFKSEYGANLITGIGRISGYSVGIMACHGSLSENDSLKGSHFIQICAHRNIPMISFVHSVEETNVTDDNPLTDRAGSITKAKSLMMRSMATRNSKLITVVVGDAVGLDYICLGGRSMESDFIFGWPNSRFGWSGADLENCDSLKAAGDMTIDEVMEPSDTRSMLTDFLGILHVQSNCLPHVHPQAVYRF